ncbi:hypothetical protein BCR44DRAFT_1446437 [Catenaria anguillulae PL171]|uniref:AAA+ ATPase domain-containing protein n=1 Tax=Catenaria anguillulae PL171 TaxID=765915 RepID=A0A1Y2H6D7_9FUNG|nr:hypothetical protein BCR44DRAFT_1446437 [Catenaria anguillulae PL171]
MPVPPPPPPPMGQANNATSATASQWPLLDKDGKPVYFTKDPLVLQAGQPAVDPAQLTDPDSFIFRILASPTQDRDQQADPGLVPLFALLKSQIPGLPMSRQVQPKVLYYNLGRLRAAQLTLDDYNKLVASRIAAASSADKDAVLPDEENDPVIRYTRHHATDLFSVLGIAVHSPTTRVHVPGLDALIQAVEQVYANAIASHRAAIRSGSVEFDGLGELYLPGTLVAARTSLAGSTMAGFRVRSSWFEEKRTLFRVETSFHIRMETLVALGGGYLTLVSFEEVYSGWTGDKVRGLSDLGVAVPIQRGKHCLEILTNRAASSCIATRLALLRHGARGSLAPSATHGRIILDPTRGMLLGHYPAQGADEVTQAILTAAGRFKRMLSGPDLAKHRLPPVGDGSQLVFHATPNGIPDHMHAVVWPALVGFSLPTKSWGHVLRLIRALVKFGGGGGKYHFEDLIQGKSGGSVFLLHGPPGVGKTLTAEAIAEMLHRPLYYVTMGELGTNPEEMEARMGQVLDLCSGWNALVLIDEADVFLEKRTTANGDVTRNAMVCVMLKMLEYHEGIMFLTTNRVAEFDPAIESRITVALRYEPLDVQARAKVWENLMRQVKGGVVVDPGMDYEQLAKEKVMNGRQIKNAVRLGLALAEEGGDGRITMDLVRQTMAITAIGREEMSGDVSCFKLAYAVPLPGN